ncbi:aspartate/glutamate racemase family protein [Cryobacterium sinapicolor]|uniref:Aspartate/glutamate racemase family protein n=1 Tax=Cryobacterium sinapicolor TaxID=1259236 RepID=A0ABY2J5B2_9MICO|nr:aspartate/glutamate racemase family protein [Cryobacterium sinapicolor]
MVLGILGGMGPAATADVYSKIIAAQAPLSDQEGMSVIVYADPNVPDRSAALLDMGPSPVTALRRGAMALSAMGATHLVIACNTAHAFLEDDGTLGGAHVVDMTTSAVEECVANTEVGEMVAVLGTAGLGRSALYERALNSYGRSLLEIGPEVQELVTRLIYGVKASMDVQLLKRMWDQVESHLESQGIECAILACTELPLIAREAVRGIRLIDPAETVAHAVRILFEDGTNSKSAMTLSARL